MIQTSTAETTPASTNRLPTLRVLKQLATLSVFAMVACEGGVAHAAQPAERSAAASEPKNGALSTEASQTGASTVIAGAQAAQTVKYPCRQPEIACSPEWKVVNIYHPTGDLYGRDQVCVSYVNPTDYSGEVECSLADMASNTRSVTASVIGNFPIGLGALQLAVEYSLTEATTMTGYYSASTPAHTKGYIMVAPEYDNIVQVTQQEYWCGRNQSMVERCMAESNWAIAVTAEYSNPDFTVEIAKDPSGKR